MSDYFKGVLITPSGTSTALYQVGNATMEADEYEAKDAHGNTADRQTINHRLNLHCEYIVAAGEAVPVPGATIGFSGVSIPTVDSAGNISGTFSVGGTASVNARVQTGVSVNTSNQDYIQGSFDAVHDIVNNLPANPA